MPNDAKLGLVVGVGLVVTVAVVFFQKDATSAVTTTVEPAAATTDQGLTPEPAAISGSRNNAQPVDGQPMSLASGSENAPQLPGRLTHLSPVETRHTIEAGDTLYALAQRYYSDGERFIDIYRANRDVLSNPDRLPVGASIRIP